MMCMVHNPVGVSGNTGRVDFEESCEVIDYQLKSGLECVANRTKTPVCQCQKDGNCSKRTFQGRHHVSDHMKGYAGDSESNFYNRTLLLLLFFAYRKGK